MKAVFENVARDVARARLFCAKMGFAFDEDMENLGLEKDYAGCFFRTHDVNGKTFCINLNTHHVSKAGYSGWNGKTFKWSNVQIPKFTFSRGAQFQVIFNEEGTACVVARRCDMEERDNETMQSFVWKVYDMTGEKPVVIQTSKEKKTVTVLYREFKNNPDVYAGYKVDGKNAYDNVTKTIRLVVPA